jgi:hypothetical protein
MNILRHEASRHLRNKRREYPEDNINNQTASKNTRDLHRGINEFKNGYPHRTNLVKDEKGDLFADSHGILNKWKNYFSQLLNVHRVSDIIWLEIHTAKPLVPEPGPFEIEIAVEKLKRYKSPGIDKILAVLI